VACISHWFQEIGAAAWGARPTLARGACIDDGRVHPDSLARMEHCLVLTLFSSVAMEKHHRDDHGPGIEGMHSGEEKGPWEHGERAVHGCVNSRIIRQHCCLSQSIGDRLCDTDPCGWCFCVIQNR